MRPRLPSRDVAAWLVLGLAIREAFSFWTGHPYDLEVWIRNAYFVAHGVNPYTFMPSVPGLSVTYLGTLMPSIGYLPLWPLILAGLYDMFAAFPGASPFLLYFLIKQPPILGDLALGGLIFVAANRWGAERAVARRLLAFWMVFPYAVIISAIWGQFDNLVAALLVGSLLATSSWKRSTGLGLGILLKFLPVIYVPYFFLRARGRERWVSLLALAVPAAFTAAVFLATGWRLDAFSGTVGWQTHGTPQGLTLGSFVLNPVVNGFVGSHLGWFLVLGYLWIPGVLVGSWWIARRFEEPSVVHLVQAVIFLTVVLFLLRWEVNEQYLLYLLPLLLLDVTLWHPERRGLFHATWLLGLLFLLLNNSFLVGFAAPGLPGASILATDLVQDPTFSAVRLGLLDVLTVVFSIHLVQVGAVVANPNRSAIPWAIRVLRRTWSASVARVRGRAAERGG